LLAASHNQEGQQQRPSAPGGIGQSAQQQLLGPMEDTYMNSRADALRNVESTIVELGGIFEQLAHMVQEQGEVRPVSSAA